MLNEPKLSIPRQASTHSLGLRWFDSEKRNPPLRGAGSSRLSDLRILDVEVVYPFLSVDGSVPVGLDAFSVTKEPCLEALMERG